MKLEATQRFPERRCDRRWAGVTDPGIRTYKLIPAQQLEMKARLAWISVGEWVFGSWPRQHLRSL